MMQSFLNNTLSPYIDFSRQEWAKLRANTPLTLSEDDLDKLRGLNTYVSLEEVVAIYLPLSRLLDLYVVAGQRLYQATNEFLGHQSAKVPYVIGVAGSVAVGKSTTSRVLQALLQRWPSHPKVDLVTTDGFLYPNGTLKARKLMHRKGFPESYDQHQLLKFMAGVKSGRSSVKAPIYSHTSYDIVPGAYHTIEQPDIMIVEGLNILQDGRHNEELESNSRLAMSDFFDFSIYVDASAENLRQWYVERFLRLRETAFQNKLSYFHNYARLSHEEAVETAEQIWKTINAVNLEENIKPTRERAKLILKKGPDHSVQQIRLRKL